MWSEPRQREKRKEENIITDVSRNVRFIHMQVNTPKIRNKTRASKVKEALMIISRQASISNYIQKKKEKEKS